MCACANVYFEYDVCKQPEIKITGSSTGFRIFETKICCAIPSFRIRKIELKNEFRHYYRKFVSKDLFLDQLFIFGNKPPKRSMCELFMFTFCFQSLISTVGGNPVSFLVYDVDSSK